LVNETVARALPRLRHRHLLEFTKLAETQVYAPNQTIIPRDVHVEHFFMIQKGEVEVVLLDGSSREMVISRLKPGEFFGEIELLRGGRSIANVRAFADESVEVLAVKRDDFLRVIKESPVTADEIGKILERRLEEHRTADSREMNRIA
jgi:CRP-like cAMP-binding protein